MIHLRQTNRALSEGSYCTEPNAPENCLVFHRAAANQHVMVALNLAATPRRIDIPRASILLSSDSSRHERKLTGSIDLAPNEGVVLEVSGSG
jgi:hypothetical protein